MGLFLLHEKLTIRRVIFVARKIDKFHPFRFHYQNPTNMNSTQSTTTMTPSETRDFLANYTITDVAKTQLETCLYGVTTDKNGDEKIRFCAFLHEVDNSNGIAVMRNHTTELFNVKISDYVFYRLMSVDEINGRLKWQNEMICRLQNVIDENNNTMRIMNVCNYALIVCVSAFVVYSYWKK